MQEYLNEQDQQFIDLIPEGYEACYNPYGNKVVSKYKAYIQAVQNRDDSYSE